ncbi:MAG: bifunctional ornithine acetyltransferase/N-acetylglutamate synthase, partial [Acetobacterium sp.]|nr:bifunctional ornithine acetyltransferase/N-acetylglutamate synthase [Acetobacterium sp.]
MKVIKTGGVTTPTGFNAGGINCGIKKSGTNDLAMIVSEVSAATSIMTTSNVVKAAPILWCNKVIANPYKQAVVVNSGNANACTGQKGEEAVVATATKAAAVLGLQPEDVLIASTGVIGVILPVEKILAGIDVLAPKLGNTQEDGDIAANTILTTDTIQKTIAVEVEIAGKSVKIGGMAKGSGMIHPNMATMLSFVTTDAKIEPALLDKLLKETTVDTYNMISVDGDTSTNDMVTVIANGLAG